MGDAAALLAIDVDTISISTPDSLDTLIDKLANLVIKWNTEYTYCLFRLAGKKSKEGNCQDFVDDVLSTLGITFNPQGPLKQCLETMRTKGKFEFVYYPSPEAKEYMNLKLNSYTFNSHEELDKLIHKYSLLEMNCKQDYNFLKSMDRFVVKSDKVLISLFLQFNTQSHVVTIPQTQVSICKLCNLTFLVCHRDEESKPFESIKYGTLMCDCPFGDPRETKSFLAPM